MDRDVDGVTGEVIEGPVEEFDLGVPGTALASIPYYDVMPVATVATMVARREALEQLVAQVMVEGEDYGAIPGAGTKPVLFKNGAEKMIAFFGLELQTVCRREEEDWLGERHGGEPFLGYVYAASIHRNGYQLAQAEGSATSWEKKYRYRNAEKVCPACGQAAIIKGKAEYGGGWLCFAKRGGCGAKYREDHPDIIGQATGQVANPDVADLANTLRKMAQKRAMVAAVLVATGGSGRFTQDLEDGHGQADPPASGQKQGQATTTKYPPPAKAAPVPAKANSGAKPIQTSAAAPDEYIENGGYGQAPWSDEDTVDMAIAEAPNGTSQGMQAQEFAEREQAKGYATRIAEAHTAKDVKAFARLFNEINEMEAGFRQTGSAALWATRLSDIIIGMESPSESQSGFLSAMLASGRKLLTAPTLVITSEARSKVDGANEALTAAEDHLTARAAGVPVPA